MNYSGQQLNLRGRRPENNINLLRRGKDLNGASESNLRPNKKKN